MPKYMLIMRSTEAAIAASADVDFESIINAMGEYNESLISAGVMVDGAGLSDPAQGFVVDFSSEDKVVTDGPDGEIHELFNGFWIIETATRDEAIEWARRCPMGPGTKLEVRRVTDESDFVDFADNEYLKREFEAPEAQA